ncbi:MAG TPA: SAM-dependent methyltransferase [Pseudonocardiaceae bacterium]|nr:SAM-dependent methyltransferase [Pseudonocardiaceae bacterium]
MTDPVSDAIPQPKVDLDLPNVARIYDYLLGGEVNWIADRLFGDRVAKQMPLIRQMALANRQFLNRVVAYLARTGVRQFLDIGSGIPSAGNTHEVADQISTDTHVVYVDNEAVAVAHGEELLDAVGDPGRHAVVDADLRNPDDLWAKAMATGVLDPDQPIALLMISVLHLAQPGLDGQDVSYRSVARYRELLPVGSYLAISHGTTDGAPPHIAREVKQVVDSFEHASNGQIILRSRREIELFMGDFAMVDPGMVWTPQWRPTEQTECLRQAIAFNDPSESIVWAGVGVKR